MFAEKIGQPCSTVGTGAFQLPSASTFTTHRTWRQGFSSGDPAFYLASNDTGTIWEVGYGSFTTGSPDQLTRNLVASSSGALISWVTVPYRVYSVPVGAVMAALINGGLGGALPAWAPAGYSRWSYDDNSISTIWKRRLKTAAGEIELGRHDVAKGVYFPSPRRPWTAVGATNKSIAANDIGGIFTFDNAAAARILILPANNATGVGHGFRVGGLGLTPGGQHGIVLTPAAGDGIEGGADGATKTIPGGARFDVVWDQASDTWRVEYLNTMPSVWSGRRQTVAAGPVSTAGLPTFLPSTTGTLSLTAQNITATARFVATAANGWDWQGRPSDRVGVSLTNPAWTGLTASRAAATPNFLYVVIAADGSLSTGSTIVAPISQWGGTPATTAGLFTFNIGEMKGYLGNGSTAPEAFAVFVGEAATSGSGVISTVAYALNGLYDSGYTGTLPTAYTATVRNHNVGEIPRICDFRARCNTSDLGYAVGDEISGGMMWTEDGAVNIPFPMSASKLAASVIVQNNVDVLHKTTGARSALTRASWDWRIVADRGWG